MDRLRFTACAISAVAVLVVASGVALAARPPDAPRQETGTAQVFTEQQAAAGKKAYTASCASCHMPDMSGNNEMPPLAGTAFMGTWGSRSTKELFDYLKASMPYGLPSLSMDAYESITAYILESNGAVAGAQPLRASTAVQIASVTARSK